MLWASRGLQLIAIQLKRRINNSNNKKPNNTMSYNCAGALKCQCLCQLPVYSQTSLAPVTLRQLTWKKNLLYYSGCGLALCDIKDIFKQTLKHFSTLSCTTKSILKRKLLVLSNIWGAVIAVILVWAMTVSKAACATMKRWEGTHWHAGQCELTLQINGWKALEETTISFKTKKLRALTGRILLEEACRKTKTTLR